MPWVMRVLKSFDPMTLRNSVAVGIALRRASELGFTCAVTGDGADELFGGYSFTHRLDDDEWLTHRDAMSKVGGGRGTYCEHMCSTAAIPLNVVKYCRHTI